MATTNEIYYEQSIRAGIRGLYLTVLSPSQFYEFMVLTIQMGLRNAWIEGLEQLGLYAYDMTPEEKEQLRTKIQSEYQFIPGLMSFVSSSAAKEIPISVVVQRVELWRLRYQDTKNYALLMAKGDPKLEWVVGPSKTHCPTCLRLEGKVKRQSVWRKSGYKPQSSWAGVLPNPWLDCGGYLCQCGLVPTTKPGTPGPMPKARNQ